MPEEGGMNYKSSLIDLMIEGRGGGFSKETKKLGFLVNQDEFPPKKELNYGSEASP